MNLATGGASRLASPPPRMATRRLVWWPPQPEVALQDVSGFAHHGRSPTSEGDGHPTIRL